LVLLASGSGKPAAGGTESTLPPPAETAALQDAPAAKPRALPTEAAPSLAAAVLEDLLGTDPAAVRTAYRAVAAASDLPVEERARALWRLLFLLAFDGETEEMTATLREYAVLTSTRPEPLRRYLERIVDVRRRLRAALAEGGNEPDLAKLMAIHRELPDGPPPADGLRPGAGAYADQPARARRWAMEILTFVLEEKPERALRLRDSLRRFIAGSPLERSMNVDRADEMLADPAAKVPEILAELETRLRPRLTRDPDSNVVRALDEARRALEQQQPERAADLLWPIVVVPRAR
jgi:hypothetical protein